MNHPVTSPADGRRRREANLIKGHEHGAYLGSVRCVQTLRERCVMDAESDCWHLRTARGRPMARGRVQRLFLFGVGNVSALRAVHFVKHGQLPKPRQTVYRVCESYDCVNPEHVRTGTRHSMGAAKSLLGLHHTPARGAAFAKCRAAQQVKVTAELKAWLAESGQSDAAAAHGLGVSQSRASQLRRDMLARPTSVFQLGALS